MRMKVVILMTLFCSLFVLCLTGQAKAQQEMQITIAALDEETFVTVRDTAQGDILSLYRIRENKIHLLDAVFNGVARDIDLPKRYLHRLEIEGR